MPSVRLSNYPELREAIEKHAVRWLHGGAKAVLRLSDWLAIREGREPNPPLRTPYLGNPDPHAHPTRETGCGCDPPLEA